MAKNFVYPATGFYSATITDANYAAGTFNSDPPSETITGEERINDQSIGTALTDFANADAIQFDFGTDLTADTVAFYFNAAEADSLTLYASANADASSPTLTQAITDDFTVGWNVITLAAEHTKQYWFLVATSAGGLVGLTEMFLGVQYDFPINFELNNTLGELSGADNITAWGGQEYSNKRHENKSTWDWNWKFMSAAHKAAMDTLNSTVGDHTKFIYDDETTKHWVKQNKLMKFTEVAPSVYSTSVSLREQLI